MPKTGKRRRKGTVAVPDLQEVYTPPSSSKKARLSNPTEKIPETSSVMHSDGSPRSWSVQEVSGFLKENGIAEEVAKLFEGNV